MCRDLEAEKLYEKMIKTGFSDDVARVYCYLLCQDYASISKISIATNLIEQKVKIATEYLLELRVVAFDIIRKKYILYALDPDIVWEAHCNNTTWRFVNTLDDYDMTRASDNLPVKNRDLLEYFNKSMNEIIGYATKLYRSYSSVANHRWRDAIDDEHMATLLSESIQQANFIIRGVSSSPRLSQVALIWQSIVDRMEKGVKYHRVADLTEIIEHGLYVVQRDMEQIGVRLMILDTTEIDQKFYVVDKSLVVVYHKIGVEGVQTIGRVTNYGPIVDRYKKRFDSYSKKAIPGHFVLAVLRICADQLLNKIETLGFNEIEQMWFKCLINWGMFCKVEDPYLKDLGGLEERALHEDLIIIGTTNQPIPKYNITIKEIRALWERWSSTMKDDEKIMQDFLAKELLGK